MKKVYIQTWGCQMNEYDSEKMVDILNHTEGYELTEIAEEAELLLLNTCSIREKAQEKVFSQLGRWRELKKENPNIIIGVGGCVASQEGANIKKRAPYVDIVFGPQTLHRLPEMIAQLKAGEKVVVDVSFPEIEKFDRMPEPRAEGPVAFVSVIEGCNKYCSFCVVPYTRGEEVSRPLDSILFEIVQLAEQGVREINLLGQNVNAYRGKKNDGSICTFAELLTYVASVEGIDRLRFITSHPIEFSDDIIEVYRNVPELVSYLHLPVQSGSDDMLNRMKRNHTVFEYKHIIRKLKEARPDILISSDFIVGYPNESDSDFEATMNLIADIDFDVCYSFIYSARPGTPAADEVDEVSDKLKKERLSILQNRVNQQVQRHSREMMGTEQIVLVEGLSKKNIMELTGRTPFNRIVNFQGGPELIGTFVKVKITDVFTNSLRGGVIATEEEMDIGINKPKLDLPRKSPKFKELD